MKLLPFALSGLLLAPLAAETPAPTRIYVNASAGAGGDGTTWATAFTSLQDALTAAGTTTGGDEIWVASGTYTPDPGGTNKSLVFQLASGVAIYGGFAGGESNREDRNPDPATNGTVLSGDLLADDGADFTNRTDNSGQIITTTGADVTAILDGFTIRGGNASFSGGGMGGTGSPSIEGCIFTDNQSGYAGGAIGLSNGTSPTFTDCQFVANKAAYYGGAIDSNTSTVSFVRCSFLNNLSGFDGGAVLNYNSASHYTGCSFRGNTASNGAGSGSGGAIYIREALSPRIDNCEFVGNLAEYGGGIYTAYNATPTLTNVTISGNHGQTKGGGIYNAIGASPLVNNSVIWNNASASGNTLLEASVFVGSGTPTFSHCIIEHSGGSTAWDAAAGNDGGSNLDSDPTFTSALDPLSAPSTGGDFSIPSGSAAIDAGLDTADLDGPGSGTDTIASISEDIAGNPRFEGNSVDIGAYEYFEGTVAATFASMFPALDPAGDANGNGLSNFAVYALGGDPTAAHDPGLTPSVAPGSVTFGHRGGASDVTPIYKKSTTLDSWTTMQPGIDYNVISSESVGDRIVVTLALLNPGSDTRMFFIQEFPEP